MIERTCYNGAPHMVWLGAIHAGMGCHTWCNRVPYTMQWGATPCNGVPHMARLDATHLSYNGAYHMVRLGAVHGAMGCPEGG